MKLGCLLSFLSFCALILISVFIGFFIDLLPGVNANYEGLGGIAGGIFFLFVGPMAFIYGFREQAKRDKEKELKNRKPENLRPLKLRGDLNQNSTEDETQK